MSEARAEDRFVFSNFLLGEGLAAGVWPGGELPTIGVSAAWGLKNIKQRGELRARDELSEGSSCLHQSERSRVNARDAAAKSLSSTVSKKTKGGRRVRGCVCCAWIKKTGEMNGREQEAERQ